MEQNIATQNLIKILKFSLLGMAAELRTNQDNIILREKFGHEAIEYKNIHHFNRKYNDERVDELKTRYQTLLKLAERTQEAVEALEDAKFKSDFASFFGQ